MLTHALQELALVSRSLQAKLFPIHIWQKFVLMTLQEKHSLLTGSLPPANEVWGKVMFLHLSVILSTRGWCTPPLGRHPQPDTPGQTPLGRYPPCADTPWADTPPLGRRLPPADTPWEDNPPVRHSEPH